MIENFENLDKTKKCIGIDLGTTNTAVALSRIETNGNIKIEDLEIAQRGYNSTRKREVLPSIVYIKDNEKFVVGAEAEEFKDEISKENEEIRYIENSKRDIGTQRFYPIAGKRYTPTDIAQKILEFATKHSRANDVINDSYICITVPANFNSDQVSATTLAAEKAGLGKVRLYPEPKAAILSYMHEQITAQEEDRNIDLNKKNRILVIDLGGGTCDICIEDVTCTNGTFKFDSLGVPNRENIGGVDFDTRIAEYLKKKFVTSINLTPYDHIEILKAARQAKEKLSNDINYFIKDEQYSCNSQVYTNSDWLNIISGCGSWKLNTVVNGENIRFQLSIAEFIDIIRPLIESNGAVSFNKDDEEKNKNIEDLVFRMLEESDISIESIDYVFFTGGMAQCFPIEAMVYNLLKKPIIVPNEPFLAVSRGAALLNKYPTIEDESNDPMPRSIMMEMADGSLKTLISAGESVPVSKTVDYDFKTKSQNGVEIRLFEGKNEYDSKLRKVNSLYKIKFRTPKDKGRSFTVSYAINKSKQIKFEILFTDNNEKYIIESQVKEEE